MYVFLHFIIAFAQNKLTVCVFIKVKYISMHRYNKLYSGFSILLSRIL